MEQTIDVGANGAAQPKSGTDALIDSALDFLSNEGPANDTVAPEKPRTKPKAPEREPREPEQPEEGDEGIGGEDAPEGDAEGDGDEEGAEEGHERGSKDDPFSVKDLPKDKFIEIKVDGEKTTVSLSELADGYIREKTFSARITRTKRLADEAQAMLTQASELPKRLQSEFQAFIKDHDQIYDFFLGTEEREQVFARAAERYALLLRRFRENPHERLAFQRHRDQERLGKEREAWESQKRAAETAAQRKESMERTLSIFKPGWEAGLRKAGFPTATRALYDEVMVRCRQLADSGGVVTSDDVATFTERAAKLLELPRASDKRLKAPPQAAPREAKKNGDKRVRAWDTMPAHERRKSPDFFLQNLRPKDFR
jgi:hypothetical protein